MDLSHEELVEQISDWDGKQAGPLVDLLNEYQYRYEENEDFRENYGAIQDQFAMPLNGQLEPDWFDFGNWYDESPIIAGSDDGYVIVTDRPGDTPDAPQWVAVGESDDNYWIM